MAVEASNTEVSKIKIYCSVERIKYYKNEWGVIEVYVDEIKSGKLSDKTIILKGTMPQPELGKQYLVSAKYSVDPKWGDQYEIITMIDVLNFNLSDQEGQKKFLLSLFTPSQVENMYKALDNPFETLKKYDYTSLQKVHGCGMHRAEEWCEKFNANAFLTNLFIELDEYNLTTNMMKKLMSKYKSPDLVIEKVKNNPYSLIEIEGINWITADKIALNGGMEEYGVPRVKAFIQFYLATSGGQGFSWVTPDELLGAILDNVGEEVADATITQSITELYNENIIYYTEAKDKIGLANFYNIEEKIATELLRLKNAKSNFVYDNWEDEMHHLEHRQGWKYTDEQVKGVKEVLKNNVCVVYGEAGCGKTSLVNAMLAALRNYSFVQTSLAGRAAARMSEVTGAEGFTIHRLLGYPDKTDKSKNKFLYHDDNQLPYNIVILDEISMVDAFLFYNLIRAIPSGSKLIMLGDIAQLEAIGCGNIAFDMIQSPEIPTVYLTEIHRQAAASAIITESRKIRKGIQIINSKWTGTETRGELQDLTLTCYSDRTNTLYKILQKVSERLDNGVNIMDVQVIVPVKEKGEACTWTLNNAIQEIYNPENEKKKEAALLTKNRSFIIREGDKVINTKNNYSSDVPIYNGNIGIVQKIITNEYDEVVQIIVDFVGIGIVAIDQKHFSDLELAYAITVHKVQGSQFDYVIFGLDFASYGLLTRELVYTGITRAKRHCDVIAETGALRMATGKEGVSKKQTYLQECLAKLAKNKIDF